MSLQVHLILLSIVVVGIVLFLLLRLHFHVLPAQVLQLLGQLLLPLLLPRLLVELVKVDPAQVEFHEVLEILLGQSGRGVAVVVVVVVVVGRGTLRLLLLRLPRRRIRTARGGSTGLGLGVNLISTYGLTSDN